MSDETHLALLLLTPLLAIPLLLINHRHPNLREAISLGAGGLLFWLVLDLAPLAVSGNAPSLVLAEPLPGLAIAFSLEPLGLIFALIASLLWPVTTLYAIGYMRAHHEHHQTRFYSFFAIAIAAVMGVASAANLLTLFICYEVLTLATFPLVTHAGNRQAMQGGRTYLGILLATSMGLFLPAIVWLYAMAGTLHFQSGGILPAEASNFAIGAITLMLLFGVGKAALMPAHRWLPAAMVAPTPVSALLHAVAVVKAGVFTLAKLAIYTIGLERLGSLGMQDWLLGLAAATILIASLIALFQDNLKRRLAYSTISQLGYIVLAVLLATPSSLAGGTLHIAAHAFAKITLFFCAGAILVSLHKTQISQMSGIGRQMPLTLAAFLLASLAIAGLPPFGSMWSKWYLAVGSVEAGADLLLGVLAIGSLLSLAYLLVVPYKAFLEPLHEGHQGEDPGGSEAPLPSLIAIALALGGALALFFWPGLVLEPMLTLLEAT